nr:hypothetical protein GCM10020093_024900 [Planobispora longispora]
MANPASTRLPALGPSRRLNPLGVSATRAATRDDLGRIVRAHAEAALLAAESGFDAVEIHLGHNYLVSAFLSPRLNKRDDDYGGGLAGRARLAREVTRAVRDAVGDRIAILAKLNMDDGVRGGLVPEESLQVAAWLEEDGSLDAIELTAGSSLLNPMYLFRGDAPLKDFAAVFPQPQRLGVRLVGGRFLRAYPYRDAYLLDDARAFRAALRTPLVLLGGITGAATMDLAMREGFAFAAMGRALLMEPDLPDRVRKDRTVVSACIHCNRCMPTTYRRTRCVLVE